MIDLKQLSLFVAVAQYGGYTKAAKALYISHSTLSRAVTELEREMGARLVERTNRVQRLTPAGEHLLNEGKKLLAAAEELEDKVKATGGR